MSTMTEISSLPEEVLLHLISFLPTSSLVSVWRTSRQWRDLSTRPLAARVQSSWTAAAALVTSGDLTEDVMKTLATRIQSSWSGYHAPSVAEVRCAAALAATGHLTSVENMRLWNLKLPKCEDMPILTSRVSSSGKVVLSNVTGDIGPLLSSITCTDLWIYNMKLDQAVTCSGVSRKLELDKVTGDLGPLLSSLTCTRLVIYNKELDQAATSGLVRGLQQGVEKLVLHKGVRLHIQTLLEYDGKEGCGEVEYRGDTYLQEMKTWARRVKWRMYVTHEYEEEYIVMKRNIQQG